MQQPFDPTSVPIQYTLSYSQVNLILEGLAELPRKRTDGFFEHLRAVALMTVQTAQAEHAKAEAQASAEIPKVEAAE